MIISAPVLDDALGPDVARSGHGCVKRWKAGTVEVVLLRNAMPRFEDSVVVIPWAAMALRDGRPIFSIQIQKTDLRILSSFTGESVKTLQADYGTRGFFTLDEVVMYGGGERENIGSFPFSINDSGKVESYLMEALLDSLDIALDLEEV